MTDKPPWTARNKRERQAMVDWVNARLDKLQKRASPLRALRIANGGARKEREYEWVEKGNGAVVLTPRPDDGTFEALKALEGDIEPARALIREHYPLLVDLGLVRLPPLQRGKKYHPVFERFSRTDNEHRIGPDPVWRKYYRKRQLDNAAADVKRIREIWQRPGPYGYGRKTAARMTGRRRSRSPPRATASRLKK